MGDGGGRQDQGVDARPIPNGEHPIDDDAALPDLWRITRRRFLAYAAATGAAAYAVGTTRLEQVLAAVESLEPPVLPVVRTFFTWARRRDDLLSIRFDFYNLIIDASDPANPRLVRKPNTTDAFIVAVFWPQNVAEQAFNEPAQTPDNPPVQSTLSREARLAFAVPDSVTSIPYRLEELLRWTSFKPNVVPAAQLNGPLGQVEAGGRISGLTQPSPFQTALDLPFRLVLSPHDESRWKHATAPVTRNDRTELWHTRLVVGKDMELDEPDPNRRTLRAVWARDQKFGAHLNDPTLPFPGPPPEPFLSAMDGAAAFAEENRFDIVLNSAVEHVVINPKPPHKPIIIYSPTPIQVDRLMLSALGAWTDVQGHWDVGKSRPRNNSLIEWRHRGTMGRDHYAKLVRVGYLYPYGHPAVIITITERKFTFSKGGTLGAYLRQRRFIVVRRPDKSYSSAKAGDLAIQQPFQGRLTPFRNIRFTTVVTPPLDGEDTKPFVPMVDKKPFQFHAIGTDWGGQQTEFLTSVFFVREDSAQDHKQIEPPGFPLFDQTVTATLSGQKVNLAEVDDVRKVDTSQEINTITFGGDRPTGTTSSSNLQFLVKNHDQPGFYPRLADAQIRMGAAEQVSGGQFPATTIKIADQYRDFGFDPIQNTGQLYAVLTSVPPQMRFQADKSGGVMTPNLNISGLSRLLGPVADHNNIASGQFKPEQVFSEAKLMGGLKLSDIVQAVTLVAPGTHAPAMGAAAAVRIAGTTPSTSTRSVSIAEIKKKDVTLFDDDDDDDDANTKALKITSGPAFEDGIDQPATAFVIKIKWKPPLKKDPLHIFEPSDSTDEKKKAKAVLKAKIRQDLKIPDKTDLEVKGKIENFKLNLFGDQGAFHILTFDFTKLEFTAATGAGLDVKPEIEHVSFHGILEFVDRLKDLMGKGTSAGPFSFGIEPVLAPPGVKAKVSLSVPDVTVGAFSFSHMKFSFICTIPFTDKPIRFRFEFCNRDHPFLVTVYIFGGGGYFGIAIGTDGFELFEAAIEFGAAASLNFGVASGSVQVMAGIYFKLEEEKPSNKQKTTLTGYFRANGDLCVLGIISVSVELYLGLSYEFDTKKVTGTAKLTIEVSVLFFSISVTFKVERKFGGTGDPSFVDMHTQASWNEYAEAFAA